MINQNGKELVLGVAVRINEKNKQTKKPPPPQTHKETHDQVSLLLDNQRQMKAWHPPQYSCLENLMDRGACQATMHGVTKSWT